MKSIGTATTYTIHNVKLDIDLLKIAKTLLQKDPVGLTTVKFSTSSKCKLKSKYYKEFFKKKNTVKNITVFSGIQIIESDIIPENMMLHIYNNGVVQLFLYKNDELFEIDFTPLRNYHMYFGVL